MRRFTVATLLAACASGPAPVAAPTQAPEAVVPDIAPRLREAAPIVVLPVFFVPSDVPAPDLGASQVLLQQHLGLANAHYRELLGASFAVVPGPAALYRSAQPSAYFTDVVADSPHDRAHRMLAELLRWRGVDRYARVVFLTIYVGRGEPIGGGGRTFNGAPGTGGGYVEMDHASLIDDRPYPFQSTLVHELGHAFGLTHVNCHGRDLATDDSIMSYAREHWSTGTARSARPGTLNAEERFVLSLDVFPGVHAPASGLDLAQIQRCFLGPMAETIGPLRDLPGVGYELYFDDVRVNGPDAALYSRAQAAGNCAAARARYPDVRVACRYNGAVL